MTYELSLFEFMAGVGLVTPFAIIIALQRPQWLLWIYLTVSTLLPKFIYLRLAHQLYPGAAASLDSGPSIATASSTESPSGRLMLSRASSGSRSLQCSIWGTSQVENCCSCCCRCSFWH